jgi:hypothetical protein
MITLHSSFGTKVASRAGATSSFAVIECGVVKRVLHIGAAVGFAIVVTILALGGGVAALVTRNEYEE